MVSDIHVKGDYYTTIHLYVPPSIIGRDVIKRCYKFIHLLALESHVSEARVEVIDPGQFHISLSKGINLRYHFIEPFITAVSGVIGRFNSFPITLDTISTNIYANEGKSRFFAGIGLANLSGKSKIQQLLDELDLAIGQFGFPAYKGNPHISIAKTETDISKALEIRFPGHKTLLWPNINDKIDENEISSRIKEEEVDKAVSNSLNKISEEDLDSEMEFESCIAEYEAGIASFTATSVLVTVGSKVTRIHLKL